MSNSFPSSAMQVLPTDPDGIYLARIFDPVRGRPVVAAYRNGSFWDASSIGRTCAEAMEPVDLPERLAALMESRPTLGADEVRLPVIDSQATAASAGRPQLTTLLAPLDLQVLKACGVTYVGSMIERVIEERAGGDPLRAATIRGEMQTAVGVDLTSISPGSPQATALKAELQAKGWWSQYLEVGLGPDPEVFTKGPVLSAVGSGDAVGIPSFSSWNNPEPELVLVVDSAAQIKGITLGNDVNLRDVEGRSALLLGMAKDNNRSTALGPTIRVFDKGFTIADARNLDIELTVSGDDGFSLNATNSVAALSRSFEDLAGAVMGAHHQYPDGCAIMTGTLFAPTQDRAAPGEGFTHELGDIVTIANPHLGRLVNRVNRAEELQQWTYGIRALFDDLRDTPEPSRPH